MESYGTLNKMQLIKTSTKQIQAAKDVTLETKIIKP